MRIAVIASLLLASATLCANAFADTVTFASTPGVTTFSAPSLGTGITAGYTAPFYFQPISGSSWVATNSSGGNDVVETVNFTNTFTLLANEAYSGTFSFGADDYGGVVVNGVQILAPNFADDKEFQQPHTIALLSSYFHAGQNTITVESVNDTGQDATDFAGTLNGVAVTPEPSSLILLGTGLLGIAGAARRRFRTV